MESAKELAEGSKSVGELAEYTYENLESITDGFIAKNFLGETQYGKLFRGKVQEGSETKDVIVKMLTVERTDLSHLDIQLFRPENEKKFLTDQKFSYHQNLAIERTDLSHLDIQLSRLENEKKLLTDPKYSHHENLAKLIGYCIQNKHLGSVYELRPLDTIHNLIPRDDFKWMGRIKVAYRFARLLEFLYGQQIKIRNIDARHLVVDQDFNPKLLDFSMIAGGDFSSTSALKLGVGSSGYVDPVLYITGDDSWSDVYAYGVLLLALIAQRRVRNLDEKATFDYKNHVVYWASHESKRLGDRYKSLVHENLQADPFYYIDDGVKITKLALECVEENWKKRPTFHEIVSRLRGLDVVNEFDSPHPQLPNKKPRCI